MPRSTKTTSRATKADGGKGRVEPGRDAAAFVASPREALTAERRTHLRQADERRAQADPLASDHEAGDAQLDEEGGEGGTTDGNRELDLLLLAQVRSAVVEIDRAVARIDAGSYGRCEQCRRPVPEAVPHAALGVTCEAGGLASRR